MIPILSVVTLLTEMCITASVFFIIWKGYRQGIFYRLFAFLVLGYESLFNITYMASRLVTQYPSQTPAQVPNPYQTALAIFHGTFSLIMFVALVVFFLLAARGYRCGENYFLKHHRVTMAFLIAWSVSILSGITFFFMLYIF
jgi:hypothetical protein